MKTNEEIKAIEDRLRQDKLDCKCHCYAVTGAVCTVCRVWMQSSGGKDDVYPSCDPGCPICKLSMGAMLERAHLNDGKSDKAPSSKKFVTFTRKTNEEDDFCALFKVINYVKKAKGIERYFYAFEFQKNGNPHLHMMIHMKPGYYFRDIARTLMKRNEGGYMDEQPQRGTDSQAQNYLTKDIENTRALLKECDTDYFLLYNIQLTNVIQQQT